MTDHPTVAENILRSALSLALLLASVMLIFTIWFLCSCLLESPRHEARLINGIQGGADSIRGATPQDGVLTTWIDGVALDWSCPAMIYSHKSCQSLESGDPNQEEEDTSCCCSICLCDYKEPEVVRKIPGCGHMFHVVCIDQWLRSHPTCPICRISPHNLLHPSPTTTPNNPIPSVSLQLSSGHPLF